MKRKLGRFSASKLEDLARVGKEGRMLKFSDEEWGRIADLPIEERRKWMIEREKKTGRQISWLFRIGDRIFDTLTREGKAELNRIIEENPGVDVYVCLDGVWDLNGEPWITTDEYDELVQTLRFIDRVLDPRNPNRPSIN